MLKQIAAAALAASLPCAPLAAAPADPCWSRSDVDAAKVRDLHARLSVAAAKCVAAPDVTGFAIANRPALAASNQRLKARFMTLYGPGEGQLRLDRFNAGLERGHATAGDRQGLCATASLIVADASGEGGLPGLVAVADRANVAPTLPGGMCPRPLTLASARGDLRGRN